MCGLDHLSRICHVTPAQGLQFNNRFLYQTNSLRSSSQLERARNGLLAPPRAGGHVSSILPIVEPTHPNTASVRKWNIRERRRGVEVFAVVGPQGPTDWIVAGEM